MDHPVLGFGDTDLSGAGSGGMQAGGDGSTQGGDRDTLRLSDADEALIKAARTHSPRVVVVIVAGSAIVMPWLESVPAALMLWYAGFEGGTALAEVLGGTEPGGRLPFAVPTDEAHLVHFDKHATSETYGLLHGQWYLDANRTPAHLPFGHGLSYTTFSLDQPAMGPDGVSVTITNGGDRDGSTVVQVYGGVPGSRYERPIRRLIGFKKVWLAAGAFETICIAVDNRLLDIRERGAWTTEDMPIEYSVGVDAHSTRPVP
jgi:beta-glucosidase